MQREDRGQRSIGGLLGLSALPTSQMSCAQQAPGHAHSADPFDLPQPTVQYHRPMTSHHRLRFLAEPDGDRGCSGLAQAMVGRIGLVELLLDLAGGGGVLRAAWQSEFCLLKTWTQGRHCVKCVKESLSGWRLVGSGQRSCVVPMAWRAGLTAALVASRSRRFLANRIWRRWAEQTEQVGGVYRLAGMHTDKGTP